MGDKFEKEVVGKNVKIKVENEVRVVHIVRNREGNSEIVGVGRDKLIFSKMRGE